MDAVTLRNTLFVIGAIIMAIEQGLRSAPDFRSRLPRVLASEYWNFAPLILMIIAGLIWIVRAAETTKPELAATVPTVSANPAAAATPALTTFGWENLHETGAMEIEGVFMALPKPCLVRITIPQEHRNFRAILARIISGNPKCTIVNQDEDDRFGGIANADAQPTPTPAPGLTIRWDGDIPQAQGEQIARVFDGLGLRVREGHVMPSGSQPTFVLIQIGPGSPWK
jgi:hypothetical protein